MRRRIALVVGAVGVLVTTVILVAVLGGSRGQWSSQRRNRRNRRCHRPLNLPHKRNSKYFRKPLFPGILHPSSMRWGSQQRARSMLRHSPNFKRCTLHSTLTRRKPGCSQRTMQQFPGYSCRCVSNSFRGASQPPETTVSSRQAADRSAIRHASSASASPILAVISRAHASLSKSNSVPPRSRTATASSP